MTTFSETLEKPAQYNLRIYNFTSVGIATILGGPVATAYLLSKNFKAFNKPTAALVTWPVAVIAEIGIFMALVSVPAIAGLTFVIPLIYTWIALLLTGIFQGQDMVAYHKAGGDAFKWSKGLGIGLLILAISLAILFIAFIVLVGSMGVQC